MGKAAKLEEIKQQYRDEWILVEIVVEDPEGNPTKVRLLAHSNDRDEIYETLRRARSLPTYHFFNGPIPKEGYAAAF